MDPIIEEIRNALSPYNKGFTIEEIKGFYPSRFCVTVKISSFAGKDEVCSFLKMLKEVLEEESINWGAGPEWNIERLSKTAKKKRYN